MTTERNYHDIEHLRDLLVYASETYGTRTFVQYAMHDNIMRKSFLQFRDEVAVVSRDLMDRGYGKKHVAIIGATDYEWLVSLMAVIASGGIAVPMDAKFSSKELSTHLERADVALVLFGADFEDCVAEAVGLTDRAVDLYSLTQVKALLAQYVDVSLPFRMAEIDAAEPAMILYTSGTTGQSKGVMLSHQNVLENLCATADQSGWNGETVSWLSVLPNHHVFSLTVEYLFSLITGITVSIGHITTMFDDCRRFGCSGMLTVPLLLRHVLQVFRNYEHAHPELSKQDIKNALLGEVFWTFGCSGAFLEQKLREEIEVYGILVTQGYGMTECTSHIACDSFSGPRPGSVGKKLERLDMQFVDGEIWVKGAGVMCGYYNDSERTQQALDNGWLKTGDIGYLDADGWLYITGRKKNLIILENGKNVSPEEIESALLQHDLIKEVLVYVENRNIKAEIFPDTVYATQVGITDIERTLQRIVRHVNLQMPKYKWVHTIALRTTAFSKTHSNKIKRHLHHSQQ